MKPFAKVIATKLIYSSACDAIAAADAAATDAFLSTFGNDIVTALIGNDSHVAKWESRKFLA
jgi:hypothetical protein